MAGMANAGGTEGKTNGGAQDSPLEMAKQMTATMCRQPKEAYWLGVRMENFLRAFGKRIDAVGTADVCDYLEGLMRKGQAEWQVKQSLDAIGLLMKFGYRREELSIPVLREAWGMRLNQRAGISVPSVKPASADGVATVTDRLRRVLRLAHYALKTEQSYTQLWERFQKFSGGRPDSELGPDEVRAFLEYLAVERHVSASTQKQALNALVFVFGQVLGRPLGNLGDMVLAKPKRHLPCVLTVDEVDRVLTELKDVHALIGQLLYGFLGPAAQRSQAALAAC